MKKVERENNWCSFDKLDGKKLVQGEKLRVEWPNGRITTETVVIHEWTDYVSEQGQSGMSGYGQERAMVSVGVNGLRQLAPIEGLRAERIGETNDAGQKTGAERAVRVRRTVK